MASSSLAAQTGGFAWSTAWFPEGETWDDDYAWSDVREYGVDNTIPLAVSEAIGNGSFALTGQSITEDLIENISAGTFAITGQSVTEDITELAAGQFFTLGGQAINEGLLEAIDFGSFTLSGQVANKALSDNIAYGNFVYNGRPITEAISEKADVGTFVLTGNAVNEQLLENIEVANFALDGQVASKGVRHPFGTGEFFTNIQSIQYNEVWDDVAYWVDSDLWNDGDNVDIDIVERGGVGSFSLAGQDHIKRIRRIAEGTTYTITGQTAFRTITTPAPVQAYTITSVSFLQNISEFIEGGEFTLEQLDAILRKPRYEFDGEFATLTLLTGKDNTVSLSSSENYAILDTENNEYT
jgi:hypothetical protein